MRLSRDEIRLIATILLALGIGAAVKHYRIAHPPLKSPAPLPARVPDAEAGAQ